MATMPVSYRRTEAAAEQSQGPELASRTAGTRERDLCELRALPMEDVFLFSKKVSNERLVREDDPKAQKACWSAIVKAAAVLALLTGAVAPRVANTIAGYRLEALRSEERKLADERSALDLEEAKLLSPDRLERLAHKQHLVTPLSNQ